VIYTPSKITLKMTIINWIINRKNTAFSVINGFHFLKSTNRPNGDIHYTCVEPKISGCEATATFSSEQILTNGIYEAENHNHSVLTSHEQQVKLEAKKTPTKGEYLNKFKNIEIFLNV